VTGGSAGTGTAGAPPVLFSARPEPMSFLFRYLLSFTPVVLAAGRPGIITGPLN